MDAAALIAALGLQPHPEGGHFVETFRSPLTLAGLPHGAPRAASTAILYLLQAGEVSRFHHVRSDELWHFHAGDPLELFLLPASGTDPAQRHVLGPDVLAGQRPQVVVPAGVHQAARPLGRHTLCGCTVAPGFDFADWALSDAGALLARFPAWSAVIDALG